MADRTISLEGYMGWVRRFRRGRTAARPPETIIHPRALARGEARAVGFDPEEWRQYRARMNKRILSEDSRSIKRFFALDSDVYEAGALDARTKELMGLVASLVLRCDDCVRYHVERCLEEGASAAEMREALAIALVVGGSITIPHLRRAFESVDAFAAERRG